MQRVNTTKGELYIGCKNDVLEMIEQPPHVMFDIIWNLAKELDFLTDAQCSYANLVMSGNIPDYDIPTSVEDFLGQLTVVLDSLNENNKVFIHCHMGHGRTGLGLASILKRLEGMSAEEALRIANSYCEGPETPEQEEFVKNTV